MTRQPITAPNRPSNRGSAPFRPLIVPKQPRTPPSRPQLASVSLHRTHALTSRCSFPTVQLILSAPHALCPTGLRARARWRMGSPRTDGIERFLFQFEVATHCHLFNELDFAMSYQPGPGTPCRAAFPVFPKTSFFFSFPLVAVFPTIPAAWFSCIRFESAPERTSQLSTSIGPPRFTQTWASSVIAKQSSTQWPSVLPPSRRRHVEPHPRLPRTCHPPCSVPVARPAQPSTSSTANLASHP